jgi:hypothetical protein
MLDYANLKNVLPYLGTIQNVMHIGQVYALQYLKWRNNAEFATGRAKTALIVL